MPTRDTPSPKSLRGWEMAIFLKFRVELGWHKIPEQRGGNAGAKKAAYHDTHAVRRDLFPPSAWPGSCANPNSVIMVTQLPADWQTGIFLDRKRRPLLSFSSYIIANGCLTETKSFFSPHLFCFHAYMYNWNNSMDSTSWNVVCCSVSEWLLGTHNPSERVWKQILHEHTYVNAWPTHCKRASCLWINMLSSLDSNARCYILHNVPVSSKGLLEDAGGVCVFIKTTFVSICLW